MRALITGAAGFIGSTLVDRLLAEGHEIVGVDNLASGALGNLVAAQASPAFSWHELDVRDPDLIALAVEFRPEVVCHLAAQISVRASVTDPIADAAVNVVGTVNVLEAARRSGARTVVFTSSVAVYGQPATLPVSADTALDPRSPYAASKVCAETYLSTYRSLHSLDYTTLTLANVYGPRQSPLGEAGVVAIFVDALLHGQPTQIFGDGRQTRDYVFVDDVVDAYMRACARPGGGRRFNIGTGVLTTDRALHTMVAEVVGGQDHPQFAPPRPGDLPAMAVDPLPARDGLGWTPGTDLRTGLKATVEWVRGRSRQ